jgi:response regulator of citrate/malate metabolism
MKPFYIEQVLETIRQQLSKQEAEKTFSQDKVAEFIETRARELEPQKSTANLNLGTLKGPMFSPVYSSPTWTLL